VSHESEFPTREGTGAGRSGSADRPLTSGTLLGGRYRIESVLGYGGMGVVYRARDVKLDQEIALKRIRPDRMSPQRRETLRREIILSRKVTHENVCRVYDLVEMDGEEFVSMEYLPGRTLKEIEEKEKVLPLGRGLSIAKGICNGLAAAHRIGVLHRDLKPENVIVSDDGKPRLMDFGIAVESAYSRGERGDTVPGTPQFLAPELLRGEAPSQATDVYAMGVVLYEMFTGRVPFDDSDTARLVRRVLAEAPPKIELYRPDLPPELRDILDRAIAKDPDSRFPDASSLADAIGSFEGQVLDRVLAEVSVTRAKMVKLMVILEANKALAATLDARETLRIILKTATSETDAERGTIFLKDPVRGDLVSQVLEGGSVDPIRLPSGRGIAGTVARTGEILNIADVYSDPRFDSATDAASGFSTRSILAAPMRTPAGEIVGVVEILNKRRRHFTKEDEEFLAQVGTHAALAVEGVRQHEQALEEARRQGMEEMFRISLPLLAPGTWPETTGFESAPLRWHAEKITPLAFGVEVGPETIALLLLEAEGAPQEAFTALVHAVQVARPLLAAAPPAEIVARASARGAACSVTAARWEADRVWAASAGASQPTLLRAGRPVPLAGREATLEVAPGDLLVLCSSGLAGLQAEGRPFPADKALARLARAAEAQPLSTAFAQVTTEWKRAGLAPGERDVVLLAARRAGEPRQ
jgi:putative methionine-R-sulfoxide reductase with GAF domain/predicted Ser/Thr protein kinase